MEKIASITPASNEIEHKCEICEKNYSNKQGLKRHFMTLLGMGRACFFWIGSSPSPYFLDRVEPGLQILYLEPMRAKKNSV